MGFAFKFCLLSTTNDVRAAENNPACEGIGLTESVISTDEIWTNKYKDTIHVVLQSLDLGLVVALCFVPVKRPEGVGTAVKIAYHARFWARIITDRATFAGVFKHRLLSLWWPLGLLYIPELESATSCA